MPDPAVAGIINQHYVEARHHTDHDDEGRRKSNIDLQEELQGNPSLPFYMLIDPKNGEIYGTFAGFALSKQSFIDFLNDGVAKASGKQVARTQ